MALRGRRINNFLKSWRLVALGVVGIWVSSTSFQNQVLEKLRFETDWSNSFHCVLRLPLELIAFFFLFSCMYNGCSLPNQRHYSKMYRSLYRSGSCGQQRMQMHRCTRFDSWLQWLVFWVRHNCLACFQQKKFEIK